MDLRYIKGNTYSVESNNTSLGLYVFDDGSCLLIDSGANQAQAQKLLHVLEARGWTVYAIFNSHAHADHCGGNRYIQENTHCRIYASAVEAAFIGNPILIPYALYSAYPPRLLTGKFFMPQASEVTDIIGPGQVLINGQEFEVLDLTGHSLGQLGIRTPDEVLFAGDSLLSAEILEANPFLYLVHPGKQMESIEKIKAASYSHLCLSHGGLIEDIPAVLKTNEKMFISIVESIKDIIVEARSPEAIMREVISRHGLQVNRNHYFRLESSISAFLAYLCNNGQARVGLENNKLFYQAQNENEVKLDRQQIIVAQNRHKV